MPRSHRLRRLLAALVAAGTTAGCGGAAAARGPGAVTPTPAPGGDAAAEIRAENAKPGTPNWGIRKPAKPGELEGFADRVSVLPGEPFRLYVSTTAAGFTVHALRVGWYGGATAREIWTSATVPGRVQASAAEIKDTLTDYAPWDATLTVETPDWPPGSYLLRLDASTGAQSYLPIVVRTRSNVGRLVLIKEVTTEQAYNTWGGRSLYKGRNGRFDTRSRAVSFDRPYATGEGSALFFHDEFNLIALAERNNLPVGYATDIELDAGGGVLDDARAVISEGHDEYWSRAMRLTVRQALDHGVNLAFLGANEVYRKIRFGDTALGPRRLEIDYKVVSEDPLRTRDPDLATGNWRDEPRADPESTLSGEMYECFPGDDPLVVVDSGNWIWAGTGVHDGTKLRGLVGVEYDAVDLHYRTPRPIEIVAHSPARCKGHVVHADAAYHVASAAGAGVFDAGTMRWVCAMNHCGPATDVSSGPIIERATLNILRAFANGPAGREHPARDFTTEALESPPTGAGSPHSASEQ